MAPYEKAGVWAIYLELQIHFINMTLGNKFYFRLLIDLVRVAVCLFFEFLYRGLFEPN